MLARIKFIAMASVIALMIANTGLADGIEVGGSLTNVVVVGQTSNLAQGASSTATQSLGSLSGNVEVGGSVQNITVVGKAVNLANGNGAEAEMSVGSIHDVRSSNGVKQTVVVRNVVNVATGSGTKSCLSVGYGKHCKQTDR